MGCPKITYRCEKEVIEVPPLFVIGAVEKKEGRPKSRVNNTPFRFNGKELDEETGNYYYGARYYDPQTSVWLSVDQRAHWYPSTSPYAYVMNNPVNLIDPTGMSAEDPDGSGGIGGFFNKLGNWLSGNGWVHSDDVWQSKNPDGTYTGEAAPPEELGEVVVTAPAPESSGNQSSGSSGSMGSGVNIFGTGSNGVDNWNSGLNPLFSIDMTDPFWSAFFGWGQKEKYNDAIPGSDWSDDVKDMTKAVTDAVQVVDGMGGGGETPVAPVPDVPQPTNPDTTFQINVRGTDGWYRLKDTTMSKSNASGFLKDKEPGVTPNVYR